MRGEEWGGEGGSVLVVRVLVVRMLARCVCVCVCVCVGVKCHVGRQVRCV